MRALAVRGERAAALTSYEAFARRLDVEYGLEPDAVVVRLAERIRHEREWRVAPERTEAEPAESRRPPLVGRGVELGKLLEIWREALAGRPSVAFIEGDVGTGKSRLAEELLVRARLEGAHTFAARAVPGDRNVPWSVAAALSGAGQGPAGAEALRSELTSRCAEGPAVLLLDDAHWADPNTLRLLHALLRDMSSARLLVTVTAAGYPEVPELEELRVRSGREVPGATVRLGSLGADALLELCRRSLPGYGDAELDRVARRLAVDSAGLPLLAVELLHAIALGLDLSGFDGAWPRPFETLDQTLPTDLPDAVVAAIRIGFRRLGLDAQRLIVAAAALDEPVRGATLGQAVGLQGEALDTALDELEWRRWLEVDGRGYGFVARVARDVIARDMTTRGQRERILGRASSAT